VKIPQLGTHKKYLLTSAFVSHLLTNGTFLFIDFSIMLYTLSQKILPGISKFILFLQHFNLIQTFKSHPKSQVILEFYVSGLEFLATVPLEYVESNALFRICTMSSYSYIHLFTLNALIICEKCDSSARLSLSWVGAMSGVSSAGYEVLILTVCSMSFDGNYPR